MAEKKFEIPDAMQAYWSSNPEPVASAADIAAIEASIGVRLPAAYVEFVTRFGFVVFGEDEESRDQFSYSLKFSDREEIREHDIAFLHDAEDVAETWRNLTTPEVENDQRLPKFPTQFIPVGNDASQGQILLDTGEQAGSVWLWPERLFKWGTEDNTWLGFVAEDFYDFINGLQPSH